MIKILTLIFNLTWTKNPPVISTLEKKELRKFVKMYQEALGAWLSDTNSSDIDKLFDKYQ